MVVRKKSQRKGAKKNYKKLADGAEGDNGEGERNQVVTVEENGTSGGDREQNEDVNKEVNTANTDHDGDEVPLVMNGGEPNSDDEILAAREKLKELKAERDELSKKSKMDLNNREKKEVEESLRKLKERRKKAEKEKDEEVTVNSLRSMQDVVTKVDKLMDKKLHSSRKTIASSDSDSDSTSSSDRDSDSTSSSGTSDSSDCDGSEIERKKKSKKKKTSKKSKKSRKHRSGKSKRLTSNVKYPQKWPHSHLSLHFVNKDKKYEELSLAEFCAGFATILETSSDGKRAHRLAHFKELMYLATRYQWRCVLNYHAACLLEIERGRMRWGDNFQVMQNTTLAGGFLQNAGTRSHTTGNAGSGNGGSRISASGRSSGSSVAPAGGAASGASREEGILFCRGYQRGLCQKTGDHYGNFYGENRFLKHICAKCWLRMRSLAVHPETSDTCPLKDEQ